MVETVSLSLCVWIKQPAAQQEVEYESTLMNPVIEQRCSVNIQTVLVMSYQCFSVSIIFLAVLTNLHHMSEAKSEPA